ncbi:MAG: lamin tail domain-containing protein, partial [Cytophagaceae bacterium]
MSVRILYSLLCGFCLLLANAGHGQSYGRVVINEYMPWPSDACGTTSEFVELMNFGPGPTNIGCYILTNGTYSVTIPAGTVLQPGQYYVIAGQNNLPLNCGNIDSAVTVNLNWTTCGCTNAAIPTTGDGFMADGGGSNVNLVLFDANMNVVDAVTRSTPTTAAANITSSSNGCTARTFDLDNLS